MKRSDELKQKRAGLLKEIEPLASKAELSDDERTAFSTKSAEIETLNGNIELAEKQEEMARLAAAAGGTTIQKESDGDKRDLAKFSMARAIRVAANMESGGIEEEMRQEGEKELRGLGKTAEGFAIPSMVLSRASTGQNVTTAADGGNLVQEMPLMFFDALQNEMVLTQLGANFMSGLTGNVPLVGGGSFTASFVAEGDDVSASKMATSKATMSPKRVAAVGALSKQLIAQSSVGAQELITRAIVMACAQAIQTAAINGSGSGANPTGILNTSGIGSVAGGTNGLAITWANLVKLETEVSLDNAAMGKLAYLTNSKVVGALKTIERASGTARFLMENGQANGFDVLNSNGVPSTLVKGTSGSICSAAIFGAWDKLHIGSWGGIDIVVDPYTLAGKNELKVVVNQFADVALERPEYFAAIKDILT